MEVDLSQFHSVFFEECQEGIECMEKGLLNLDPENVDIENINTIFRAAHSIKGGAGTFGFMDVSDFTHTMETILDEMRGGARDPDTENINLLLQGVDCLRNIINCKKEDKEFDKKIIEETHKKIKELINDTSDINQKETVTSKKSGGWKIRFYPYENFFLTGNDPMRIIRELNSLGDLLIDTDLSKLPPIDKLDPEKCYLGWNLHLSGDATIDEVKEIFSWVDGDCELEIILDVDRRKKVDRRRSDVNFGRRRSDLADDAARQKEATSIRVGVEKIDSLVDLVGELIINQSILNSEFSSISAVMHEKLRDTLEIQQRLTHSLQDQAMSIRMMPINFAFQRLPRLVHDLCESLGKKAQLNIKGQETELDRTVLERISDPLVHLVRNSLDHGLELPEERLKKGKPETGEISINAFHQGGNIVINISDDGAGLNKEGIKQKAIDKNIISVSDEITDSQIMNLIFMPGLSTSKQVSDVSGRGVGMDIVKNNINQLGGSIEVKSEQGQGCMFTIRLPLTLAILEGQLVGVGEHIYIIPLITIIESVQIKQENLNVIAGQSDVYRYRDEYISILNLKQLLLGQESDDLAGGLLIVVDTGAIKVGLYVDEVVGQQQVVIKSLEKNYQNVSGIAGASILGDGSVTFILDVPGLIHKHLESLEKLAG